MKKGQCLILGSGASTGIPVIGCRCPVCTSTHPRNRRLRTSALLKVGDLRVMIDIGPDFREQALTHHIDRLDGVIITHAHYDHIGGIDELRVFYFEQKKPLPCLLSGPTFNELKKRYYYLFEKREAERNIAAQLDCTLFPAERGAISFLGIPFHYMTYSQGGMPVNGLRFGNFAYISDIQLYPETLLDDLKGVEVLILSALRFAPSHVHFNLDQAVDFARKVGAKQTWLVHMAHEIEHEKTNLSLPPEIQLGYDGLEFDFHF